MAAEIFQEGMDFIIPKLETGEAEPLGKIVIGTVEGDIHDIGKNIVTSLLEAEGFEIRDLGVDIPPQEFVNAVKDEKPEIVGMSGLLTQAIEPMKDTIEALEEAGLRKGLKVIIGGSRMDEDVCEYVKADDWVDTANEGVRISRKWIKEG